MTIDQIKAMVAAGESDTLEFKSTTGARREAAATFCAMQNQRGGHVFFGVTPEGAPVGQQVSERAIEALSAELGRIDPPAFPTVERLPITGDREIVLIDVSPGLAKPYQYRGTAYRCVGNTTARRRVQPRAPGGCTAISVGRTRRLSAGRSPISMRPKSGEP